MKPIKSIIILSVKQLVVISILAICCIFGYLSSRDRNTAGDPQAVKEELQNPTKKRYRMTSPYGWRKQPINGVKSFHNGEDYATPHGTKLYSPASGRVKRVFKNPVGGLQVIIKHDNGYSTGYAHLSHAEVKAGDRVNAGEYFAKTGNTGYSTGPHLHLTLRNKKGKIVAPSTYLYK